MFVFGCLLGQFEVGTLDLVETIASLSILDESYAIIVVFTENKHDSYIL